MTATVTTMQVPQSLTPALHDTIKQTFAAQEATALRLRESSVADRIAKLKRLKKAILAHRQDIVDAAAEDFQRPAIEAEFAEIMPVLMDISDHCRHLKKWLKPKRVRPTMMMIGTSAEVRLEPRGRCLIIAPWNYPVTLTLGPLVPAIACGNTVMIKTSEVAPAFSSVLCKILRSTFDDAEVAVFEGDASVATALLELPFDHSFFTGAPSIGKIVMEAAAKHLTSVTLELGGKSPVIVDRTADIEMAAKTVAWGKYVNSGQTCIAPDHVFVHTSVKQAFIDAMSARLREWYGEGEASKQAELGRIINTRHAQRVAALLDDAVEHGATIAFGGAVDVPERFVSPTLLTNVPAGSRIMSEEIFGPILPIFEFESESEVVEQINAGPKPLALYLWTKNKSFADDMIRRTSAGGTCINHISAQFLHHNLPFGGVNNSGIGSYHGEWGIRAFSHERAVLTTRVMLAKMFFPPYTATLRRIINWILKIL